MLTTQTLLQSLTDCRDKSLAGGKAVNLGILLRAGFTVPDGFCVTTDAYRHWAATREKEIPRDLTEEIVRAYRAMGSPAVAVRSRTWPRRRWPANTTRSSTSAKRTRC
jgi:phosphoenolpyruvate synthase/pyruvate phosphate dikinase